MKSKKMLALMLFACLTITSLVGCGQNAEESKASESTSESKVESSKVKESESSVESSAEEVVDYSDVTLRIAWWGNDTRAENTVNIIEEFKKDYPGLEVEVEYCAFNDYYTRINTQAAGGTMPDVWQLTYTLIPTYASSGQLKDISSLIDDGIIDISNVDEASIAGCLYDGKMYGISTGINFPCMIYNATLLEELGLSLSETPTMSEYLEVSKKVYEETGVKASLSNAGLDHYMISKGGGFYTRDSSGPGFTSEWLTEYWTLITEGIHEGYIVSREDPSEETVPANFEKRIRWSEFTYSNFLESYQAGTEQKLAMCALPVADDATVPNATFLKPNTVWGISENTEHPELAAAFIDFFTNEQIVYDVCGTDRGIPINSTIRETMTASASEAQKVVYEFLGYLEQNSALSAINTNVPENDSEYWSIYYTEEEPVLYGEIPVEDIPELANDVVEQMNALAE